jgi:hypothetical protein
MRRASIDPNIQGGEVRQAGEGFELLGTSNVPKTGDWNSLC